MVHEIRKDILGKRVIISSMRSKRQGAFEVKKKKDKTTKQCPFCPSSNGAHEKLILAYPNEKNWKVGVFMNKFPALSDKRFIKEVDGIYESYTPRGYHEILVETSEHTKKFHELPAKHIALSIKAIKERCCSLIEKKDIVYITIFKNYGERGGASISHSHMQIIASPIFPETIADEMTRTERYFEEHKKCPSCKIIETELRLKKRVVIEDEHFVCFNPYISTWPYQVVLYPKRHFSGLSEITNREINSLAIQLKIILTAMSSMFEDFSYNMMFRIFPNSDFWHFHVSIYPRIVTHAGFEFFGLHVNIVSPEDAAKNLRKIIGTKKLHPRYSELHK